MWWEGEVGGREWGRVLGKCFGKSQKPKEREPDAQESQIGSVLPRGGEKGGGNPTHSDGGCWKGNMNKG